MEVLSLAWWIAEMVLVIIGGRTVGQWIADRANRANEPKSEWVPVITLRNEYRSRARVK